MFLADRCKYNPYLASELIRFFYVLLPTPSVSSRLLRQVRVSAWCVCYLLFRSLRPRGVSDEIGLRSEFIILFHLVLFLMRFPARVVIMSPPSTPPSSQLPEPLPEAVLGVNGRAVQRSKTLGLNIGE